MKVYLNKNKALNALNKSFNILTFGKNYFFSFAYSLYTITWPMSNALDYLLIKVTITISNW